MEAGEHVGRNAAVGHRGTDACDAVQIPLAGIFAVHQFQHLVAAALHRQVDVVADVVVAGHRVDDGVAQVLGIAGGEAHAHLGSGLGDHRQQARQVNRLTAVLRFVQVGIDVLAQQGHLLEAAFAQVGQLVEDALRLATAFTAACIGHDAVGAEVVAPSHDADKAAHLAAAHTRRDDVAIGLGRGQLGVDGLLAPLGKSDECGQFQIGIRTSHHINVMLTDEHFLQALGHTADNADDQAALPLVAVGVQLVKARENLLFSIVAHRARVDENSIGLIDRLARLITCHLHYRGHHFAVGHIHLAAVGLQHQPLGAVALGIIFQFHCHIPCFLFCDCKGTNNLPLIL